MVGIQVNYEPPPLLSFPTFIGQSGKTWIKPFRYEITSKTFIVPTFFHKINISRLLAESSILYCFSSPSAAWGRSDSRGLLKYWPVLASNPCAKFSFPSSFHLSYCKQSCIWCRTTITELSRDKKESNAYQTPNWDLELQNSLIYHKFE